MHTLNDTFHLVVDFNYNQVTTFSGINLWVAAVAFTLGVFLGPFVFKAFKNW